LPPESTSSLLLVALVLTHVRVHFPGTMQPIVQWIIFATIWHSIHRCYCWRSKHRAFEPVSSQKTRRSRTQSFNHFFSLTRPPHFPRYPCNSTMTRLRVLALYKQLRQLGRDYPDPSWALMVTWRPEIHYYVAMTLTAECGDCLKVIRELPFLKSIAYPQ